MTDIADPEGLELEDDDADTEDGDGGDDHAILSLETPESAQAIAAALKASKIKKPAKGKPGADKFAGKFADKGESLSPAISDKVLGLGDPAPDPKAETEDNINPAGSSAYDLDAITDPELNDSIDPLTALLGAQEKPWQNEKLSTVEKMILNAGYDRNPPDADPDLAAVKSEKPKTANIARAAQAAIAASITLGVAAAAAAASKPAIAPTTAPTIAGVSRGPSRAADQDQNQIRTESAKPSTATSPLTVQARQNADDVTLNRMTRGLAATITATIAVSAASPDHPADQKKSGADHDLLHDLLDQQNAGPIPGQIGGQAGPQTIGWSPVRDPDAGLRQTMDLIYMALGADTLMNVSPYRQAGWDEKRTEQRENARDLTLPPLAAEAPKMAETLDIRRDLQINLGPGGPG